jgi:hypothetical protein
MENKQYFSNYPPQNVKDKGRSTLRVSRLDSPLDFLVWNSRVQDLSTSRNGITLLEVGTILGPAKLIVDLPLFLSEMVNSCGVLSA